MKNNKIMRAAALMMTLTLMTSCFAGGTFAKYVTKADGSAGARVAKFGVTLAVEGDDMFKNTYSYDTGVDADKSGTIAVKGEDEEKVVAPGTSSKDGEANNAMTFSIYGKPEVAVKLTVSLDENKEIFLKNGEYRDWTYAKFDEETEKTDYSESFTLSDSSSNRPNGQSDADGKYYPVVYTLKLITDKSEGIVNGQKDGEDVAAIGKGTLAEVNTALQAYLGNAKYGPGEELDATFELSWEWPFESGADENEKAMFDKADTLLGNLAAETNEEYKEDSAFSKVSKKTETGWGELTAEGEDIDYSTDISYKFTMTVTQID